jgi:hypothetical protein
MHIYVFGSLCRGDIAEDSDVDLLALVEGFDKRFDPNTYSIYSYGRIQELWHEGNPFAWHLSLESKLVFASDNADYIALLGPPDPYKRCSMDCEKFFSLFMQSYATLLTPCPSVVFELSTLFLSIRNIATCYSLGMLGVPCFSRDSALRLGSDSVPLPAEVFSILKRSRILSTRGCGENIEREELVMVMKHLEEVKLWMNALVGRARKDG